MGPTTLIGGDAAVLVGPGATTTLLRALSDAVRARQPLDALVAALSTEGIAALPSFACVVREGASTRLLVRGDCAAKASGPGGPGRRLSHPGVATWEEATVHDADEVELTWERDADPVRVVFFIESRSAQRGAKPKPKAAVVAASSPVPQPTAETRATLNPSVDTVSESYRLEELTPPQHPPAAPAEDDDFDFAHLVEDTRFVGVEAAAVRNADDDASAVFDEPLDDWVAPAPPPPSSVSAPPATNEQPVSGWTPPPLVGMAPPSAPAAPARPSSEDTVLTEFEESYEDGTMSLAQMRAARGAAGAPGSGPQVQAVLCPSGHPNAPIATDCRVCGTRIDDHTVVHVPRPSLGLLRFDDGLVVAVDRPMLLGRKPAETGAAEDHLLVTLPDPEKSLSRTHLEVRVDDWHVWVVDLGSTNGTVVANPGAAPEALRMGEQCLIGIGATVTLGDVVGFRFDPAAG